MRYPAAETAEKHAKILDTAIRLFRERGFGNVSVAEIMNASGLTHGPFYNHFASKEALVSECVARELDEGAMATLAAVPPTVKGKAAYIASYLSMEHRDSPGTGCAVAALAADLRHEPEARGPFTERMKKLVAKTASHFPFRSPRSARGDAIRMTASMVGALVLARAVDDDAFSQEILDEVRKGLTRG